MSEENLNPLLKAFQEQKVSKQNAELMAAQRLVNLYRSLHCFKPAFADEFNQILLSAGVEEKRLLTTIMGGNEVRSYADFLQQQTHQNSDMNSDNKHKEMGFLPTPDQDEMYSESSNGMTISQQEWQQMKEQQKLLMEQTQMLANSLKNAKSPVKTMEVPQAQVNQNYSDIIEDEG